MSLTVRQLRYFVATAELGQISQAAIALSISQSAITTAVKELEQIVGFQLFRRSSNGMELTDQGRQFRVHADEILAKINDAMQIPLPDDQIPGSLTIAAMYTVMGYFLPYHLDRLSRRYPNLHIKINEASREGIEEGLLSNRYDIGVMLTSLVVSEEIVSETLLSSVRRLWTCSGHPLLDATEVSLELAAKERYIMLTMDEAAYSTVKYWKQSPSQPDVVLRTSSVECVRSMVANGQGITILSDMMYRPWSLEGKRIETIVTSDPVPAMNVGLAWRRGTEFTPSMRLVRKYFRDSLQTPGIRAYD